MFYFADQLPVYVSLDAWALADNSYLVPLLRFEETFRAFLVLVDRVFAWIKPTAHSDSVDATWFAAIDFALVAFGLTLLSDQTEAQTRVETCVVGWNLYFSLHFEVGHL